MSSRIKATLLAVSVSVLGGAAHAAVECPATSQGHRLAQWGGTLYQGDPADDMSLAPTHENPSNRGVNLWKTPTPVGIVLVCRYAGGRPLTLPLTADVSGCTQTPGSFVCK